MVFNKTTKNSIPLVLILAFTGFFTGKTPDYVSGISPFFSDFVRLEAIKFRKAKMARLEQEKYYDGWVQDRIEKIISKYYTGLDEKNDVRIPKWILAESKKYGYDPFFLTALIITESSFYNWAKSSKGARGLMQLRPASAVALASETSMQW